MMTHSAQGDLPGADQRRQRCKQGDATLLQKCLQLVPTSSIKAGVKNAHDPRKAGERYRNLSNGDEYLLIDHFIYLAIYTNLLTTSHFHTDV